MGTVANSALADRITEFSAHLHAATAELAIMAAEFDSAGGWTGVGMRGCAHWLSTETGVGTAHAGELVRVGHALAELPLIREAFRAGRLSFDKVRVVTQVATAEDEHIWLELALQASGGQLLRICNAYRDAALADDPQRSRQKQARRRVVTRWRIEDGMLELSATLPPEEGQLVVRALESAVCPPVEPVLSAVAGGLDAGEVDPDVHSDAVAVHAAIDLAEVEPEHPYGARRADALVRICERWLDDAAAAAPAGAARSSLVVHVDLDTLTGQTSEGRCHLEDGPAIAVAAARRIGCNADVVAVIEKGGVPLDVGRARRFLSPRHDRLVKERDKTCLYPVCPVPADDTEAHHVRYWTEHGGRTDLANLVSLCRFHHHRLHEGEFRIVATATDPAAGSAAFRFETGDGCVIGRRRATPIDRPAEQWLRERSEEAGRVIDPSTPVAGDRGGAFDVDHAAQVIAHACERARQGAKRPPRRPRSAARERRPRKPPRAPDI